jgi:hypothetical protein
MTPYLIAIIALGIFVITLSYIVFLLNKRISILLRGKNAKDLEDTIRTITEELAKIYERLEQHSDTLKNHNTRIGNTIKQVPTVRFNPFYDSGGNQSFASAFITEDGNGVVISSLYSREKTSVFAKPIKNFQSSFELTEEERDVLEQAKKN